MKQSPEESIRAFSSRLVGTAELCDLFVTCSRAGCEQKTSYRDEVVLQALLRGMHDVDIRTRVLSRTQNDELSGLAAVVDYIAAEEASSASFSRIERSTMESWSTSLSLSLRSSSSSASFSQIVGGIRSRTRDFFLPRLRCLGRPRPRPSTIDDAILARDGRGDERPLRFARADSVLARTSRRCCRYARRPWGPFSTFPWKYFQI